MGQLSNRLLEIGNGHLDSITPGTVQLGIDNGNFLRNYEYFSPMQYGYTLMGSQLAGVIRYDAHASLRLEGGIYLLSDYGGQAFRKISPIWSVKWKSGAHRLIMGNLESNVSHRLIEPLLNYESYITQNQERGLQWKIDHKRIWSDTWINWERMQYLQDSMQEVFSAGHSSNTVLLNKNDWQIMMALQGLVTHQGGQIDTVDLPMTTQLNLAVGIEIQKKTDNWLESFFTQNYYLLSRQIIPGAQPLFPEGNALFLNAGMQSKGGLGFSLGYWQSEGYTSMRGAYLFRSMAGEYGRMGFSTFERKLLFARVYYQKQLAPGFSIDVRLEPYHDISSHLLEYAYSMFLVYRKNITLTKIKS